MEAMLHLHIYKKIKQYRIIICGFLRDFLSKLTYSNNATCLTNKQCSTRKHFNLQTFRSTFHPLQGGCINSGFVCLLRDANSNSKSIWKGPFRDFRYNFRLERLDLSNRKLYLNLKKGRKEFLKVCSKITQLVLEIEIST